MKPDRIFSDPENTINPLLLKKILRVSPEPSQHFSDLQVHRLLCDDLTAYLDYLDRGLTEIGQGSAQLTLPAKQLFKQSYETGDFRVMPCVRATSTGQLHKTVKLVGTNRAGLKVPDQISVGKAFYLDPVENFISHEFAACLLSSIRTGACAALAAGYLQDGNEPLQRLTLAGAGRVGFYAALCLLSRNNYQSIQITDPLPGRASAVAAALRPFTSDCEIIAVDYADLEDCDLLVLSTTSNTPIYHPDQFAARIVISVGADCVEQREIHDHPQWRGNTLYVDSDDSLRFGDLAAWQQTTPIHTHQLTDITHLAATPPANGAIDYPALFISTGSALLDNLTMSYLVELTAENQPQAPPAETDRGTAR